MRELTQIEMNTIHGGATDLEIGLLSVIGGSGLGAIVGGILMTGNAVGDYAFIGNAIGTGMGLISGAMVGAGLGVAVGLTLVAYHRFA
ncbi:hypothetical protein [Candidatus Berkiella aquae]|uniref:Uncharacterized protein n=1 Tax=Candidatus Berkiella aquae TaxID=295108 RepID=A0A0Q9YN07_9GAMM|nr:hypothetical protein [Candidatus Berkiella aquae]MCS5712624.1 hypothetical protein [Candidatus Berkiella aquae]